MKAKDRILAALTGKDLDRIPWCPFLAYWWDAQSPERQAAGQLKYLESIGADPMLRGFSCPFRVEFKGTEIEEKQTSRNIFTTFKTPVGSITMTRTLSKAGNTWFTTGHPIVETEDFKVLTWMYEHAELYDNPSFDETVSDVGDRGLYVGLLGAETKTCFQSLVEKWVGIQNLTYFLADEPEAVDACLYAMRRVSDKTAEYAARSKAEAFIFWEDSSTTSINPAMFEKYTSPEIRAWSNALHGEGKLLLHHACGHLRALLKLMALNGIDAIESISSPTTGNIDIFEAFSMLPEDIALVGGIEPVFFANCNEAELENRVNELLTKTAGRRFILANADSCPPEVAEWKLRHVSETVRKFYRQK